MSCQLVTSDTETDSCDLDPETGCVVEGVPTFWRSPCLQYAVQVDGSMKLGIEADQLLAVVEQAFAAWKQVECPGGGSPSFTASFQGFVSCGRQETVCGGVDKNVNVVMFQDADWPTRPDALGLATPTGYSSTGEIVDSDIQLNSQLFRFDLPPVEGGTSLPLVVVHEVGHFLGLDHSQEPVALMASNYGDLPMVGGLLLEDDIAGICEIFPPSDGPPQCSTQKGPAYDTCRHSDADGSQTCSLGAASHGVGCGVVRRPATRLPWWVALAVIGLVLRRGRAAGAVRRD